MDVIILTNGRAFSALVRGVVILPNGRIISESEAEESGWEESESQALEQLAEPALRVVSKLQQDIDERKKATRRSLNVLRQKRRLEAKTTSKIAQCLEGIVDDLWSPTHRAVLPDFLERRIHESSPGFA